MITSETIPAGPLEFYCLTAGKRENPLLLFLHGFPEYSGAWEEMLDRLSDQFFCVAPDQRGYGRSSKPEGVANYAAGRLAGDAAAVLTHFAPRARAVIGHDWGASVAYALTMARPELMEKLVILNGAHPIPFQKALAAGGAQSQASQYIHYLRREGAEERLSADGFAKLLSLFAEGMDLAWLTGARKAAYLEAWGREGALTGMLNWYRAMALKIAAPGAPSPASELIAFDAAQMRIRPPHLLIWGMGDRALLPASNEGLEALCDDLTRVEIDGADHWITHQKPDEVAGLIRKFCESPA